MLIARFLADGRQQYGIVESTQIRSLRYSPFSSRWNPEKPVYSGLCYALTDVRLLAPCEPSKYLGVGLNYIETIEAMKKPVPERPVLFVKPSTSVIADGEEVCYPEAMPGSGLAFEGELAVVIGKVCKKIQPEQAKEYILGYTATNDVSDMEKMFELSGGNSVRVKSADTFGPLGPYICTDLDPDHARIQTWVDDILVQDGNTSGLLFKPAQIVSYISQFMTLLPGDVIATGTPQGIQIVKPGQTVTVRIEGIGTLRNRYAANKQILEGMNTK